MALIKDILISEIRKISDIEYTEYEGFPESINAAAERWTSAFDIYAKVVIPISLSSSTAKSAMLSVLIGAIGSNNPNAIELGITTYTSTLAVGMAPTFIGTPPLIPLILTPSYLIGFGGGSALEVANSMSSIIDGWMRTGLATPSIGGTPIPWS